MSRFEGQVFSNRLAALRHNRLMAGQFFVATVPGENPRSVYVVAVSLHAAQLALVDYLMGVTKWSKKKQDEQYIAELEAETAKKQEDVDLP